MGKIIKDGKSADEIYNNRPPFMIRKEKLEDNCFDFICWMGLSTPLNCKRSWEQEIVSLGFDTLEW